jgi:hypothetical protein
VPTEVTHSRGGVTSSNHTTHLLEEETEFQNTKEQAGTRNQDLLCWRPTKLVSETQKYGRETRKIADEGKQKFTRKTVSRRLAVVSCE